MPLALFLGSLLGLLGSLCDPLSLLSSPCLPNGPSRPCTLLTSAGTVRGPTIANAPTTTAGKKLVTPIAICSLGHPWDALTLQVKDLAALGLNLTICVSSSCLPIFISKLLRMNAFFQPIFISLLFINALVR